MRTDHMILAAIALFYVAAVPLIRKLQRDDTSEGGLKPAEAFGLWLISPLVVVMWACVMLYQHVPPLLFPTPQVTKVRDRLRESAEKSGPPEPPPNRLVR